MDCKAEGCGQPARYKEAGLCQKHYFRLRRYGTTDLVGPRKKGGVPTTRTMRKENAKGYQLIFDAEHPLAMKDGYVYEHRAVVYAAFGDTLPACEMCGAATDWETCHVDHRDEDVRNNEPGNLRPVCPGCNTSRTERSTIPKFTLGELTLSLAEWAKQPGVTVGPRRLKARLDSGLSLEAVLYSPNLTHPKGVK
jgi:5-methylcytosine-specific restriction endonuclease McrA